MSKAKALMTVVEHVYNQVPDEDPFEVNARPWDKNIESDEDPYQRTYKVGPEPKPLDCGWIEEPGMIHIYNNSREHDVRLDEGGLFVPPRCSVRFFHRFPKETLFPVADETVKITVSVLPK